MTGLWRRTRFGLKWLLIAIGGTIAAWLVWSKFYGPRQLDTLFIFTRPDSCKFAFKVTRGEWVAHRDSASGAMVWNTGGLGPELFLNGDRNFAVRKAEGAWMIPLDRHCAVERRGQVVTSSGDIAELFLASQCPPVEGWYEDRAKANFLYGFVRRGQLADYIWMSSDHKALLLRREATLRKMLESYQTSGAGCKDEQ